MSMGVTRGTALIAGIATGPLCKLAKPISFWGGVDPVTGRVIDPRHPNHGCHISGTILVLPGTIGSSSSSAIMLELLRNDTAPAGLVVGTTDAILTLGIIVAGELGYRTIPVVRLGVDDQAALPASGTARITEAGAIVLVQGIGDRG